MNPDIKAQWVAALRSGEYRQGKHVLHNVDEDTYCCLGVLCDLAVKAGVITETTEEFNVTVNGDITVYGVNGDKLDQGGAILPVEVMAWAHLDHANPDAADDDREVSLADWNDDMRYTFEDIARLIEANDL